MVKAHFVRIGLIIFVLLVFSAAQASAVTTVVSNLPVAVTNESFSVNVSIAGASPATNYLRVDLYKEGTNRYFGETFNGSSWYSGSDGLQYLPVTIDSSSSGTALVQARVGQPSRSEYDGQGQYRLRVRRYTASGKSYSAGEANAGSQAMSIVLGASSAAAVVPSFPTSVKVNEFLPNPSSGNEWVELYNSSSSDEAILENWQLDDGEGFSEPQTFSAQIAPRGFFVLNFEQNKLNNDGDSVRLIRPDGVSTDTIDYSGTKKGYSQAFNGQSFVSTSTPTPGQTNIFTAEEKHQGKILELKRLPLGSSVDLEAYVSVPENLLGEADFYVWDKDSGIKVSYREPLPQSLEVGDKVSLASTIEESFSEKYIKTNLVSVLQKGAVSVEAKKVLTAEVSEANEGMLLEVKGKLVEQSGSTFYLDDGSGRAKVYVKDSTRIVKPKMGLDDEVRVVGISSQYGFLSSGAANFRLLPRFQSDVYNLTEGQKVEAAILGSSTTVRELPRTGRFDYYTAGWALIFLGLALRWWDQKEDDQMAK